MPANHSLAAACMMMAHGPVFFLGPTHIITLSGRSEKDTSSYKTKLEIVTIDEVILNNGQVSKAGPQHINAKGSCATTQTSEFLFLVACHGTLQEGTAFVANFEIDKSP